MVSAIQNDLNPMRIIGRTHNYWNMLQNACSSLSQDLNKKEILLLERLTDAFELSRYPSPASTGRLDRILANGPLNFLPDCILLKDNLFDKFDNYLKRIHTHKLVIEQAEIIFDNLGGSIFDETCAKTYPKFREVTKSGGTNHGILTDEELAIIDEEIEKRLS